MSKKPRVSKTIVTQSDLKRMSMNIAEALNEEARKNLSIGICLDALCTVLDSFMATKEFKLDGSPKRFTDYLKEELERRKPKKAEPKKEEPDANPPSNEG